MGQGGTDAGGERMPYELIILEKRTGKAWDVAPQVTQVTYTTNRTGSPGTLKFNILASGISFVSSRGTGGSPCPSAPAAGC